MMRIFGHVVAPEMILLWMLDFLLCWGLVTVLLLPPGNAAADLASLSHAAVLAAAAGVTAAAIGLHRPEICLETRRLLANTVVAGLLTLPVVLAVGVVAGIDTHRLLGADRLHPLRFLLTWVLVLIATRIAFNLAMRLNLFARRIVVVGRPADALHTGAAMRDLRRGFFVVAGTLPPDAGRALAPALLKRQRIWGVVVAAQARGVVPKDELLACRQAGIRIYNDVEFREQQLRRIDLEHLEPDWMLFAPGLARSRLAPALRRCFDVVTSLVFLILTLPVMLLTAAAVRLDSAGPALYRQERVGLHGQVFTLLKFRSMRIDAESSGPTWASQKDPRVTRIGAFLRRVRIDELPQLFNVLQGAMCFVGPRPERPHFVDQLAEVIPFYRDRASVKPGITGWAQVNYPYGASVEDARQKLSFDLYYVKHRSLFLDLLILFATVRVILFQEGSR